mgnify:FL=1
MEHSEPLTSAALGWRTLIDPLSANAREIATKVVARQWTGTEFDQGLTAAEFYNRVRAVAGGLIASGVRPGDRVAIMSMTRIEWAITDFAIWHAGAVTVPIYETSSAEQVKWILSDAACIAVIVENQKLADVVDSVRADAPGLAHRWIIEDGALDDLARIGAGTDPQSAVATRTPEDVATIIYTSGTTGRPKGCALTHRNLIFEVQSVMEAEPEAVNADTTTVLFLPLAHVFARALQAVMFCVRAEVGYCGDASALPKAMQAMHPTLIVAVPRVFEKVMNTATQKATESGKGAIFEKAMQTAYAFSKAQRAGGVGFGLRLRHLLFSRLVYSKLRHSLGGNLRWAVSGGAPLGERLGHVYDGMGVTILEGYGLTETTAGASINRPRHPRGPGIKIGSVGRPVPGASIRIADDGEVQVFGPNVFQGYWNNADATAAAMTADGWFRTGDLGTLDADGFLRITGRAKELIVTAGGKNVAPAVLEDPINASFLVSMSMVVGDNRPFVAALVTLDPDAVALWLRGKQRPEATAIAELVNDADLRAEIQRVIDKSNAQVSKAEQIRSFVIVPQEWTQGGGQITPSLKLKRNVVLEQHAADIEAIYAGKKE